MIKKALVCFNTDLIKFGVIKKVEFELLLL